MEVRADTLDDLLRKVLQKLLKSKVYVSSTRGKTIELDGLLLELTNPRARLSRTEKKGTVFSCLGELLWYLAGSDELDFIKYYIRKYTDESENGLTIYGAYGPRLWRLSGNNQISNVIALLRKKQHTRRAVIQIFDANDIAHDHVEIPCTCTLQLLIRDNQLHMFTNMRSNDAFIGLPHDVFAFTMLQEIFARSLNVSLGKYKHTVGSLHIYTKDIPDIQHFMDEGWQENIAMPAMPPGDPWSSIYLLIKAESNIRGGGEIDITELEIDPYWADLVRLLQIFRYLKDKEIKKVAVMKRALTSKVYEAYVRNRLKARQNLTSVPEQLELPDTK